MTTAEQNQKILNYLIPYHPTKIGVFGSYSRGENRKDSDLDLLVSFETALDLFKFMRIWDDLETLLGLKIDLVTENALKTSNARVQKSISDDLRLIYEK
jgi:predicted nucleotidyltransferase